MGKYTEDFQGVGGQTARAEHVKSELEAIETAFTDLQVEADAALKAPDGESPSRLDDAATRADKFLRFDANGDPEAVTAAMEWKGDWAASTGYLIGEVVRAPKEQDFSIYICVTAHTSSSNFANDLANWDILVNLAGLNFEKYDQVKTANFTAYKGESYQINHAGGDMTVNLPSSPTEGDSPINLLLVNGDPTQAGQQVFVNPGSNTIMGGAAGENLQIDQQYASVRLIWTANYGWRTRTV